MGLKCYANNFLSGDQIDGQEANREEEQAEAIPQGCLLQPRPSHPVLRRRRLRQGQHQ